MESVRGAKRALRLSGESLLRTGTIDTSGILCRVSAVANGPARVERVEDPWLEGQFLGTGLFEL